MSEDDSRICRTPPSLPSTKNAIRLLQRAVALDPGYSSAWAALGHLYYYEIGLWEMAAKQRGCAPRRHFNELWPSILAALMPQAT